MSDKNKKTETQEVKLDSPGKMLRAAREACGKTIAEISSQLRLRKDVIEDLENDRHERLPAPIFVRGYIRSYSALVSLDGSKVNASYAQYVENQDQEIHLGAARTPPQARAGIHFKGKNILPLLVAGGVLLLAIILWFALGSGDKDQANVDTTSTQVEPWPAEIKNQAQVAEPVEPSVPAEAPVNELKEPVQAPAQAPVVEEKVEANAQQVMESEEAVADEPAEKTAEPVGPRVDKLSFFFDADSWVDVRDFNGKRLIYRMVKSGGRRTVSGTPPFRITLGNAPMTRLLRNGAEVDLGKYTRGNVAKFSLGKVSE